MSLTLDKFVRTIFGNKRVIVCECDFDSSYPTGGESLTAANLGFGAIEYLIAGSKSGYVFSYDYTNSLLMAYNAPAGTGAAALAEVTNTTDLSAVVDVKIFAMGYGLK